MAYRPIRRGLFRRGNAVYDDQLAAEEPGISAVVGKSSGTATATLAGTSDASAAMSAAGTATAILWNPEGGYMFSAGASVGTAAAASIAAGAMSAAGAGTATAVGA